MSVESKETIADIVREMRTLGRLDEKSTDKIPRSLQALELRTYADRIEAAAKREHEATREKSSVVGNSAKMREALMEASIALSSATHHHMTENDAKDCLAVIETAISEPPRNCDVGTEEEQRERFFKFCTPQRCDECKSHEDDSFYGCVLRWSQMQYEEVKE